METAEAVRRFAALGDLGRLDLYLRLVAAGSGGLSRLEVRNTAALSVLIAAGLVTMGRSGFRVIYRAELDAFSECIVALNQASDPASGSGT